jgi:hypothetical protein
MCLVITAAGFPEMKCGSVDSVQDSEAQLNLKVNNVM